jgi:hypothetical protein
VLLSAVVRDVEVQRRSVASREQVPLMLAWSLTVHKCQGLTLDRVCLQLGSVFEHGQAYVALSRIRALDCLSIEKSFPKQLVKAHPTALAFYDRLGRQRQLEQKGSKAVEDESDAMQISQQPSSSAGVRSAAQDAEQWEEDWMVTQSENQPPAEQQRQHSAVLLQFVFQQLRLRPRLCSLAERDLEGSHVTSATQQRPLPAAAAAALPAAWTRAN